MKLVQNTVPAPFSNRAAPARAPSKLVPRRQLPTLLLGETALQRFTRWLGWR